MEMLLLCMMKKDRKIHSHTMHQEIKSETDEKGNTKLYDYNKDNLLTKVTLKWYLCKLSL